MKKRQGRGRWDASVLLKIDELRMDVMIERKNFTE